MQDLRFATSDSSHSPTRWREEKEEEEVVVEGPVVVQRHLEMSLQQCPAILYTHARERQSVTTPPLPRSIQARAAPKPTQPRPASPPTPLQSLTT